MFRFSENPLSYYLLWKVEIKLEHIITAQTRNFVVHGVVECIGFYKTRPFLIVWQSSIFGTPSIVVSMKKAYPVTNALKLSSHFIRNSFTSSSKRCAEPENLQYYARKKQTNVSLKALMETGNGKYLDEVKTGMSPSILDEASANEKILIQVFIYMTHCP